VEFHSQLPNRVPKAYSEDRARAIGMTVKKLSLRMWRRIASDDRVA